jgi:hypothetical protein
VLTRNREVAHTWADLNIADWDVEEVLEYPIQNDRCVDLYSLYSFFNNLLDTYLCAKY